MPSGDFGQTLFVWGVAAGPFVERPYFGPATLRDSFGQAVDMTGDPVGWALGLPFAWPPVAGEAALDAEVYMAQRKETESVSIKLLQLPALGLLPVPTGDVARGARFAPLVVSPAAGSPR